METAGEIIKRYQLTDDEAFRAMAGAKLITTTLQTVATRPQSKLREIATISLCAMELALTAMRRAVIEMGIDVPSAHQ